jgi:hypothetical protein
LELELVLSGVLLLVGAGVLVSFAELEPAEALPFIISSNSARLSCPSWFLSALSKSYLALLLAPDEAPPLVPDEGLALLPDEALPLMPVEPLLLDPVDGLLVEGVADFASVLLFFASSAA